ncbi:MAG TPA: hypothetical protein VHM88_10570, partial [Candidatus Acidoferrales bacterium]|nr:hypothetical protein [Candidatus Acidoferrales bacterium]
RRGIATTLNDITKRPTASSLLLRHANLSMTLEHYIKPNEQEMLDAMAALEELCSRRAGEPVQ